MKSYFDADFFINNRKRLRKLFSGTAPILITANGLTQRSGDTNFPFRQDSNFWYLTGIDVPDVLLVLDKDKEYIILPKTSDSKDWFDGRLDLEQLSQRSGIENIYVDDRKRLEARIRRVKHIATLPAADSMHHNHGIFPNPSRRKLIEYIHNIKSDIKILDISRHLVTMRSVKQPQEIDAITAAVNLTTKAFRQLHRSCNRYQHEYQAAAKLGFIFNQNNCNNAYQPIVASGVNATTLHYVENNSAIEKSQLLLIDAGAEVENYAADITRTFAIEQTDARSRSILEAVADLQKQALDILKPGLSLRQFEEKFLHIVGEKLRELGLIKIIDSEAVRQFYPHATSHFLGLDVHDVGDYEQPLSPGMVITVEPGLYITQEKIGVRIEDDVLITKDGVKILSGKLPAIL